MFNVFFFASSVALTVPAAIISLFAPEKIMGWARLWARTQIHAARIICGIELEITGWENLPPAPALMASRHESTFDILVWLALLPAACFVVKQELLRIPLWGRCIKATAMIAVDREAGASAMRALLRGSDQAKAAGRHLIIFPEGTRVDPGEHPALQPGVAAMAARTRLAVVPIMTDSGRHWGRRSFRKQPGTIRIVIQPPLVGLTREAIMAGLTDAFNERTLPPRLGA